MSSRSQRKFQSKNTHITAIVVGIVLLVLGLYFTFGFGDVKTGLVMAIVGIAFIAVGFYIKRSASKGDDGS